MEVPGILDTMAISSDKDVLEVLKQAVGDENIIFESETTQDSEETEIEEIIEIIEEVEEIEELSEDYTENSHDVNAKMEVQNVRRNVEPVQTSGKRTYSFKEESNSYDGDQENKISRRNINDQPKPAKKQVIQYDVDEDWEDEEMEQLEELDEDMDYSNSTFTSQQSYTRDKKSVNSQVNTFSSHFSKVESRDIDKSKIGQEFGNNVHSVETDSNVGHEIVKNVENNLLYTVLGSKKSGSSSKTSQSDGDYIQMEQINENTIPVEGTIYYEGENMETIYVAQSVDENEQYHYESMDQDEQTWEGANSDTTQNQEEENSQDQIYLHEDEDGQLYFKDDNGKLQPVYLTEDGNYAIAEHSDDQDSKGSVTKSQQSSKSSEEYASPEPDTKPTHSSKQNVVVPASALNDIDNEDTVTISLIISEDEHGQKRTQVIIPTTDTLKCDICNKTFKTSLQLLRHNRLKHAREEDITTRNFPCDLCPKRYPDQNSLARHRKTHTGDRPFQCLECHKNFPTATALRRHLTLHNSQSRPLPCIYCGRRFVDKASLAKHEQSHLAGDQRTHECDICQKSFSDATELSLHKKYHDPDKKFDCEVCGREFNRLNNLQRHMMVHQQQGANEEILSCDVCGITYKFMSSLTRHMVTTHMNPEKMRQQAEEQRRKRENNYRRYLENRKMYETQNSGGYGTKRNYHNSRLSGSNDEAA